MDTKQRQSDLRSCKCLHFHNSLSSLFYFISLGLKPCNLPPHLVSLPRCAPQQLSREESWVALDTPSGQVGTSQTLGLPCRGCRAWGARPPLRKGSCHTGTRHRAPTWPPPQPLCLRVPLRGPTAHAPPGLCPPGPYLSGGRSLNGRRSSCACALCPAAPKMAPRR